MLFLANIALIRFNKSYFDKIPQSFYIFYLNKLYNNNEINEDDVNEKTITENLYLSSEPDLLIRPGGEKRLSNFLLWQLAYAELFFTKKLWPEFTKEDLIEVIKEFNQRVRRFGE